MFLKYAIVLCIRHLCYSSVLNLFIFYGALICPFLLSFCYSFLTHSHLLLIPSSSPFFLLAFFCFLPAFLFFSFSSYSSASLLLSTFTPSPHLLPFPSGSLFLLLSFLHFSQLPSSRSFSPSLVLLILLSTSLSSSSILPLSPPVHISLPLFVRLLLLFLTLFFLIFLYSSFSA